MPTSVITSSSFIEEAQITVPVPISLRPAFTSRLVQFIGTTSWDQWFLRQEKWLNRVCMILIAFSVLYLAPFMIARFLK